LDVVEEGAELLRGPDAHLGRHALREIGRHSDVAGDIAPANRVPKPVFFLVRVAFDAGGRPVETCEHIMSGDRWQLSYEWAAD
jgi:DNA-binding GntR family transcriptional regulator